MPSRFSSDHSVADAKQLAENLGIEFHNIPIKAIHDEYELTLAPVFASKLRDVIFGWYHRAQVLTADRAGILACRSMEVAFTTQVKFAVGNAQVREVQVADILEQAAAVSQGVNLVQATLINLFSVTPPLIYRLEEMAAWAGRPQWGES